MGDGGLAASSVSNYYGSAGENTVKHYYSGSKDSSGKPKKKKAKIKAKEN